MARKPRGPSRPTPVVGDHSKPLCQEPKCTRRASTFRRFVWRCSLHQIDDTPATNCAHITGFHYDGVMTCTWCTGTVWCDWPKDLNKEK